VRRSLGYWIAVLAAGSLFAPLVALGGSAAAAVSSTTVAFTVNVQSKQSNAGSVEVTTLGGTSDLGTCDAPSIPGTATCTIEVPKDSGVLMVAKPATGEVWMAWRGYCGGMPGPVCDIFSGMKARTTTLVLGRLGHHASLTTGTLAVIANTPNCPFDRTLTVTGSGFPSTSAATLSDDGHVVASGTTNAGGDVSLTYSVAGSEPGLYRSLSLAAGTVTASTDVGNVLELCVGGGAPNNGNTNFVVGDSGDDANGTLTLVFGKNPKVVIDNGSTGAGTVKTPTYKCPSGKTMDWRFSGSSAVGTKWAFHFSVAIPFTCPTAADPALYAEA
jgi:hypothetical protein